MVFDSVPLPENPVSGGSVGVGKLEVCVPDEADLDSVVLVNGSVEVLEPFESWVCTPGGPESIASEPFIVDPGGPELADPAACSPDEPELDAGGLPIAVPETSDPVDVEMELP